jgi:hypothetical protein
MSEVNASLTKDWGHNLTFQNVINYFLTVAAASG